MKDPAFLFYSKDFYMGTRMMLPEERGCYVDLMIYQHQNGVIPNDIRRLMMHCSGCSEEIIRSVLQSKFNQTVDGWLNQKLNDVVNQRSTYRPKKIAAGVLAGILSKSKISKKNKEIIKKEFRIEDFTERDGELITDVNLIKSSIRDWYNQMVEHLVDQTANNIGIGNGIGNIINNEEIGMDFLPAFTKWIAYKGGRKESYKTEESLAAMCRKLVKLSGNNANRALEIVEQSMANNWAGLFELKTEKSHGKNELPKRARSCSFSNPNS